MWPTPGRGHPVTHLARCGTARAPVSSSGPGCRGCCRPRWPCWPSGPGWVRRWRHSARPPASSPPGCTSSPPLWFLGVYLLIVLAAPTMMRLHRRFGLWPAVGVLAILTAGVDAVALGSAVPGMWLVGYANMLFVWLAVHQLGFGYADGTLARGGRRLAAALALGGLRSAACGRQGGARRLWPAPRRAPGQRWWAGIRSGGTRAGRRTPRFTARPAPARRPATSGGSPGSRAAAPPGPGRPTGRTPPIRPPPPGPSRTPGTTGPRRSAPGRVTSPRGWGEGRDE